MTSAILSRTLAALLVCSTAHAEESNAPAGSQIRVALNIHAQPLREALRVFGEQTGLQVLFRSEDLLAEGVTIAPVSGDLSADEALERMLARTGLKHEFINAKTVRVAAAESLAPSGETATQRANSEQDAPPAGESSTRATQPEPTAASAAGPSGELEEITVTAQKRTERLQDVPIAMAVLTGAQLDSSSEPSVNQVLARVPGISIEGGSNPVGGATQIAIRGVGAPSGYVSGPSPVAYYLDTVPFGLVRSSLVPDANVYDLDRIEVLRGPQGTLYGANAQAGVVRVLTRDPKFDELEFKTRLLTSHTSEGGLNGRADAAVNIPVIDGRLAGRAVVGYQKQSGWIDKDTRSDANDMRDINFRFKLGAHLAQNTSLMASVWVSRTDAGAMDLSTDGEGLSSALADVEALDTEFNTYSLRFSHDFGGFSLTNTTSQLDFENDNAYGASPDRSRSFVRTVLSADVLVNEINLTSSGDGPWLWTAGAIYRDGEDTQFQDLYSRRLPSHIQYSSQSWALFGELTRRFLDDRLALSVGLRYFEDEVGQVHISDFSDTVPVLAPPARDTFDATTPRAIVSWKPSEQTNFYASYSEGFRSGLHQNPSFRAFLPNVPVTRPDLLKNYEIGSKGSLWNGRVSYETAVYHMDWEDAQLPLNVVLDGVGRLLLTNGAAASGPGVDLAVSLRPLESFELSVSGSWNDLTVDGDVFSNNVVLFNDGDRLNGSTERSVGASASYSFPFGTGYTGKIATSASWRSELANRFLSTATGIVTTYRSGSPNLVNLDLSMESPNGWGAAFFVDNLTNERDVVVLAGPLSAAPTLTGSYHQRPRTVGVQFDYHF
jgi:iron complex outermembrane recepter protein